MNQQLETSEDIILKIIDAWAAAVRRHDIEGILLHHMPNMLMFDLVGPTQLRGIDEYRRSWVEIFFPWHGERGTFELEELKVSAGDTVAFATALLNCAGVEEGKTAALKVRLTICLEKHIDQWIVVHEHHSEPFPYVRANAKES